MTRRDQCCVQFGAITIIAVACLGASNSPIWAQDASGKSVHRLPPYYAGIVTEAQRAQIYAVQDKFAKQIDELTERLNAMEKERDLAIEAVLDAAQKQQLKKAKEGGAERRKKTTDVKKLVAEAKAAAEKSISTAPKKRK
jgi:hypothetical protein